MTKIYKFTYTELATYNYYIEASSEEDAIDKYEQLCDDMTIRHDDPDSFEAGVDNIQEVDISEVKPWFFLK